MARLPATIAIALTCHILASFFGIGFGILAATRQYTWVDTLLSFVSFLGMTVPRFLMALIILYLLAYKFNVQEIGSFYSSKFGGQAYWLGWFDFNWAKLWNLLQHIWPVIAVATIGGLAYNMRVMRANLLDTLNAQYVETARAKGLGEGAVIMRHAVPNALHPLVAYQGVVLPYMLTGEIEVAIVFGLATIGPAIVGSMAIGDVFVTATLLLVLGATLIIGNIIADLLLVALDPRIRVGSNCMSTHAGEVEDDRLSTASTVNQSYPALVWRRFKRSLPGMVGLTMVSLLLLTAIFAEFIAPMDPNQPTASFAPPDHLSFFTKDGFTLRPVAYSIVEGAELDPVTYQPMMAPDMEHPRYLTLFAKGTPYHLWGLIPMERHLIGVHDGSPLHLLGTDKLGRDILSRGIYGSRLTLMISLVSITLITIIGTLLGITSGYLGGRFDMWFQRFVEVILAFPQLPLYLALATLIPPTAPSYLFLSFVILVIVGLGWAQLSREVGARPCRCRASNMSAPPWPWGPATGGSSRATSCPTC